MEIQIFNKLNYEDHNNLVFLLTEESTKELREFKSSNEIDKLIKSAILDGDFTGEKNKLIILRTNKNKPKRIFLAGLGKEKESDQETIRRSINIVIKNLKELKLEDFSVLCPTLKKLKDKDVAKSIMEGSILGNYEFIKYKTDKSKIKEVKKLSLIHPKSLQLRETIERTKIICDNIIWLRNIVNENADNKNPLEMVNIAKDIAKKAKLGIKILDEKNLKKLGMNLFLAVSQGSRFPPRLIILEYKGNKKSEERYALVGKGITFDTGGLNLKGTGFMETMKSDMAGAATIMSVLKTLSELKIKKNVIAILPFCENMISQTAYKPGDVFKSYSGKTVEILNTDAEGRLILADALSYTERVIKPDYIIDLATLTGAMLKTFGEYVCGMMGNDSSFAKKLYESGEEEYEKVWELPLYQDFKDEIISDFADMPNYSYIGIYGGYAGSIMGAAFLSKFIEKTKWIHMDIAGVSWYEKQRHYFYRGATGWGVRLLVNFFSK